MSENIKIRSALNSDLQSIIAIWHEGLENSSIHEFESDNFIANFEKRNHIYNFWVAVDDNDKVQGWQSLLPVFNNPSRKELFAESSTYISKYNRFSGVGMKLLSHMLTEAEKSPLSYIIGFIASDNEPIKKIASNTGWITLGELPASPSGSKDTKKLIIIRPV